MFYQLVLPSGYSFCNLTRSLAIGLTLFCWNLLGFVANSGWAGVAREQLTSDQYSTTHFRADNKSSLARCLSVYKQLKPNQLSKYIDASGKRGSGIYGGNSLWFGSFSECKKIPEARYCFTSFNSFVALGQNQSKAMFPLKWGVCTPEICTQEDVAEVLEFLLKNISKLPVQPFAMDLKLEVECAKSPDYTIGVIFTIIFFGVLIGLGILATVLEMVNEFYKTSNKSRTQDIDHLSLDKAANENTPLLPSEEISKLEEPNKSQKSLLLEMIHCFSYIQNTNFILNTNVGKSDLTYLHGIRVLSLFWIILLHFGRLLLLDFFPPDNHVDVDHMLRSISFMAANSTLAVDTFFLLSGLLAIYVNLKKMDKSKKKIQWLKYYFHRYWRLTPSLMLAILFLNKLRPFFGDGPQWYFLADMSKCSDYWWTNMLYINNFYPKEPSKICIPQSWFLSADMQFFLLSPLFIIIVLRYGFPHFFAFASLITLASMVTTAILIGDKDLLPVPGRTREDSARSMQFVKYVYGKPYCRIPCYIVGVVIGYIVYKKMGRGRLNWIWAIFIWCLAIGTSLTIVYAPHNTRKNDPHVWSKAESVIFGSLKWLLWGMAVAWVIFACEYGYAGLIKNILAAKFWIPLSRINYAAFILHVDVMYVVAGNIESPLHVTTFTMVNYYLSILVLTYACAFVWTVVIELPFANMEFLLTKRKEK